MPRRPRARRRAFAGVAALATALVLTGAVHGAGDSLARAWHAVFGDRAPAAFERRVIVVLSLPSLADRVAAAEERPRAAQQRRWTADTEGQVDVFLDSLRARGIDIEPDFVFARTLSGFSARLDARAVSELERNPLVVGVYPVRAVYPAAAGGTPGAGAPSGVVLPGFEGGGVTVALLDTGLDRRALAGKVARGFDLVAGDRLAAAEAHPSEPTTLEGHGTRMAALLLEIAPKARLLPLRVLGWQEAGDGGAVLMGRGDQLLAGLERAVDPDADGDAGDAVEIAAAPLVEPYAAFPDSPEARAVAGAAALGTLVVAPAGNDGDAGRAFGSVAAPGGAPAALAVGAVDTRRLVPEAGVRLRAAGRTVLEEPVPVLSAVAPARAVTLSVAGLLGPTLADGGRAPDAESGGSALADFFDPSGVSRVAGRAVLVRSDGGLLAAKARNAAAAGAAALIVAGADLPAGSLDRDARSAVPVLGLPAAAGDAVLDGLRAGTSVSVELTPVAAVANDGFARVAPFSSGGLAFDVSVGADLVAPGVALATGGSRATVTGSSAAAVVVAGAAALLAEARPELAPAELHGLLVGYASRLRGNGALAEPVTAQGAGLLDLARAVAGELATEPAVLAFGRADGAGWTAARTLTVRNVSTRPLEVGFGFAADDAGEAGVDFTAEPARLNLGPGASAKVEIGVTLLRDEPASGVLVVAAEGAQPLRVPWAIPLRPDGERPLVDSVSLSNWEFEASNAAPAVLAFRAGWVRPGAGADAIEPVALLDIELWTPDGERLGVLARLRDLLPGRYAFGLTGRDPAGKRLRPGTYVIRLAAHAVDAGEGQPPSLAETVFRIKR
jgi:Subtilase family/PA domain